MDNGQFNIASMLTVAQLVTQEPIMPVIAAMDGVPQNDGGFAGLLNEVQLLAKAKDLPECEIKEQSQALVSEDPLAINAGAEQQVIELLAIFQAGQKNTPVTGTSTLNLSEPEKVDSITDTGTEAEVSTTSEVTAQMAMAAYSQPARIQEADIPKQLHVGNLQDVAEVTNEKLVAIPVVKRLAERQLHSAPETVMIATAESQSAETIVAPYDRMSGVNKTVLLPAGKLQEVATVSEQPVVNATPAFRINMDQPAAEHEHVAPLQSVAPPEQPLTAQVEQPLTVSTAKASAVTQSAQTIVEPATIFVTAEVNKTTQIPADRLENVATVSEQPVVNATPAFRVNIDQPAAEPKQVAPLQSVATPEQPLTAQVEQPLTVSTAKASAVTQSAQAIVEPATNSVTAEVNKTTHLPADRLENVATVPEQPVVDATPAFRINMNQPAAEPKHVAPLQSVAPPEQPLTAQVEQPLTVSTAKASAVTQSAQTIVEPVTNYVTAKTTQLPADRLENVATVSEQPVVNATPAFRINTAQPAVEPKQVATLQSVASLKVVELEVVPPALVDTPQSVACSTEQPTTEPKQEISQRADIENQKVATVSVREKITVPQSVEAQPATQPVQAFQVKAPTQIMSSVLALSAESEFDIQLSQQRPIITVPTSTPVLAENRSVGIGLQMASEQQIEKNRSGNEKNIVKETTASLQVAAPVDEVMVSSDASGEGKMNQGQPDSSSDNQMLAQNVLGRISTENQKIEVKPAIAEAAQQEVPEQVMQQVKDRLVQHEVKPGNQQIRLTLSPDSLGELKMNLSLQGQKLSVEIITENRAVRDVIAQHTDALKESLARQNISMESFDVTTGGKSSGNQGQNQNAWRELAKQQQQQWSSPRGYNTAQADLPSSQAPYQRQQGQSMLDIHY